MKNVHQQKLDEICKELDLGEFAEYLNDYRGSSDYITDAVAEIADDHTSIYYYDIMRFIADHPDALADVVAEGLYSVEAGQAYDLYKHGQAAEFMVIEHDIYNHLDDAVRLLVLDTIAYDADTTDATPEQWEGLFELLETVDGYTYDRFFEITDAVREILEG